MSFSPPCSEIKVSLTWLDSLHLSPWLIEKKSGKYGQLQSKQATKLNNTYFTYYWLRCVFEEEEARPARRTVSLFSWLHVAHHHGHLSGCYYYHCSTQNTKNEIWDARARSLNLSFPSPLKDARYGKSATEARISSYDKIYEYYVSYFERLTSCHQFQMTAVFLCLEMFLDRKGVFFKYMYVVSSLPTFFSNHTSSVLR